MSFRDPREGALARIVDVGSIEEVASDEVAPTFVFTWDGFRPDRFASGRLAGKKQREFNS